MKEPNMFHNYETEKITRKAGDMSCSVLLPELVMQDALNVIL